MYVAYQTLTTSSTTEQAHLIKCEQYHTTKCGGSRCILYQKKKKDQRAVSSVVSSVVKQLIFTDKCMLRIQTRMSQSQRQRHGKLGTTRPRQQTSENSRNSNRIRHASLCEQNEQCKAWMPRMPTYSHNQHYIVGEETWCRHCKSMRKAENMSWQHSSLPV